MTLNYLGFTRKVKELSWLESRVDGGLKAAWQRIVREGVSIEDDKVMADYLSALASANVTVAQWQVYRRERGWKVDARDAWERKDWAMTDGRLRSGLTQ